MRTEILHTGLRTWYRYDPILNRDEPWEEWLPCLVVEESENYVDVYFDGLSATHSVLKEYNIFGSWLRKNDRVVDATGESWWVEAFVWNTQAKRIMVELEGDVGTAMRPLQEVQQYKMVGQAIWE